MEACENRRRFVRVNVGPDHWVVFRHRDRHFKRIPMTDLSVGGCCIRVLPSEVEFLEKGASLSMLRILHPGLPNVPIMGRVTWIMGKKAENTEGVALVGIEFVNPSPDFMAILGNYVTGLLADIG